VLGGDHAVAAGTIAGIVAHARKRRKKVGVLWVDAHADMNTPATSPSGNVHGMPLAALLGLGPDELLKPAGGRPAVDPANVALVGIRSLDPGEKRHLRDTGVGVFTMPTSTGRASTGS